jgi:tRNA (guanine37-N1)-methyltransferase
MRFEIVTIFPGFFTGIFEHGIIRRALAEGLVTVGVHDLRAFTHDRHRTVDDRPFGGGEGMVLKAEPLAEALASLGINPKAERVLPSAEECGTVSGHDRGPSGCRAESDAALEGALQPAEKLIRSRQEVSGHDFSRAASAAKSARALAPEGTGFSPYIQPAQESGALAPEGTFPTAQSPTVILLSAQGRPFTQSLARELASLDRVVLICGRYEGVDERINQLYCDMELSIGDYVLSGGELAAAVVVDATMRLIPGVLGNEASGEFESFGVADAEILSNTEGVPRSQHGAGGLLDYPHYTRPSEFGGLRAPEVLMNGDHLEIRRWRREQQLRKTLANRPDLLQGAALSEEDRRMLNAIRQQQR